MMSRSAAALLLTGSLMAASGACAAHDALPPEHTQGDIRYLSGGIGADESDAIKTARSSYALSLLFASTDNGHAAYESDVHVSVIAADGSEVLETVTEGPYLLIELPPGKYRIVASARGELRKRDVKVVAGKHQELGFQWTFKSEEPAPSP